MYVLGAGKNQKLLYNAIDASAKQNFAKPPFKDGAENNLSVARTNHDR